MTVDVKHHCTIYGAIAAFTAIFCGISLILVNTKEQECTRSSYDQLQAFNAIGLVASVVLAVSAMFRFAQFLHDEMRIMYFFTTALTLFLGCLFCYSAAYTYWRPCVPTMDIIPKDPSSLIPGIQQDRNVFSADDGQMIAVFFLQLLAAIGFVLSAFNWHKRV
ncbi:hypothetical protein HDE_06682 [Halotydeus destructor]|nr:hypothetical protein HDE_06682 [Halotydeus destructor]